MINRNVTRTVLNATETTAKTTSMSNSALAFPLLTTDSFYIGYQGPFAARHFLLKTVNSVASVVSVSYWNGTIFTPVEDLLDQTFGFTQSGFISWGNLGDWRALALSPISDSELYWVKVTVSANLSAGTEVQAVENLFSDDDLLRQYWPEVVSDSRFKPIDATGFAAINFYEQHRAAKDMVVLRLKQRKMIDFESQIIDINSVAMAAVHACAWVILNPIATSDDIKELASRARAAFDEEISQVSFSIDKNEDGIVSDSERRSIVATSVVRR